MKELNLRELINYKRIPFNIYNEKGQILAYVGDLLTSGILLELREAAVLIYDENFRKKSPEERQNPLVTRRKELQKQLEANNRRLLKEINEENNDETEDIIHVEIPDTIKSRVKNNTDGQNLKINTTSVFSSEIQLIFKEFYKDILEDLEIRNYPVAQMKFIKLTNIIESELSSKISKVQYISQLKLLGEYKICHSLNVAIISGFIRKVLLDNSTILSKNVILSGLMHDIGKTRLNQNIVYNYPLDIPEQKEYERHVIIGYKIIKEIFKLGNTIARPALEHHIMLDGTGFPKGLSLDNIAETSNIIAIANYYDNITCNRINNAVESNFEVGKILLNIGAKKFSTGIIYGVTNKYILNDKSKIPE